MAGIRGKIENSQPIIVRFDGDDIVLTCTVGLDEYPLFDSLVALREEARENTVVYRVPKRPLSAFALACFLQQFTKVRANKDTVDNIRVLARKIPKPRVILEDDGRRVRAMVPLLHAYKQPLVKLNATPRSDYSYSLPIEKALDLMSFFDNLAPTLPRVEIDTAIIKLLTKPIDGYDGTLESLKHIGVDVLAVVQADNQTYREKQASGSTMSNKLARLGIKTLHDLLFYTPYRHIDKSQPQDVKDLVEGETVVLEGKITRAVSFAGARADGSRFTIADRTGREIDVSFFNQKWLMRRFKEGADVIITGKLKWYNRKMQINGASIEFSDEAANLPIVPVYRQSPTNGLTTYRILCAVREMFLRLSPLELEPYFDANSYSLLDTMRALHLPENMEAHYTALEQMALRELFYLQVFLQTSTGDKKEEEAPGLTNTLLVDELVAGLPFELTDGQKRGLSELRAGLAKNTPANVLLCADVGAGKTVLAQLCALQSYGSGHQSAILAPTDVLAQQLYASTVKAYSVLPEDERPPVIFYSGSLKAKEKREALSQMKATNCVVVGTQSLLTGKVALDRLGFVAIDEQQKFGTAQRQALLHSRTDGLVPHMLSQSATPIPRSIAQVVYGDVDLIELKDKPAGRLPIKTQWLEQSPNEFIREIANPIHTKVLSEARAGNQTFIVAPVVEESVGADTASVKSVYKILSQGALGSLRVGMVHGQMKKDEQRRQMTMFRDKEYDALVCSTIVEVGVDVPDATVVVVLSADRMGASSLHQIRGRVGRNDKQSYCFLVATAKTEGAKSRLESLVASQDGFEIAQRDLETRGEGKVSSLSQSGKNEMQFVSLLRDKDKLGLARDLASRALQGPYRQMAVEHARAIFS